MIQISDKRIATN